MTLGISTSDSVAVRLALLYGPESRSLWAKYMQKPSVLEHCCLKSVNQILQKNSVCISRVRRDVWGDRSTFRRLGCSI